MCLAIIWQVNILPMVVVRHWVRCGTRVPGARGKTGLADSTRPGLLVIRCWDRPQTYLPPARIGLAQTGPDQMDRGDSCRGDSGVVDSGFGPDRLARFGQALLVPGLRFRSMDRLVLLATAKRHQRPEATEGPIASTEH